MRFTPSFTLLFRPGRGCWPVFKGVLFIFFYERKINQFIQKFGNVLFILVYEI